MIPMDYALYKIRNVRRNKRKGLVFTKGTLFLTITISDKHSTILIIKTIILLAVER